MLRHSLGGEVFFSSLQHIVASSLNLVHCLCNCLVTLCIYRQSPIKRHENRLFISVSYWPVNKQVTPKRCTSFITLGLMLFFPLPSFLFQSQEGHSRLTGKPLSCPPNRGGAVGQIHGRSMSWASKIIVKTLLFHESHLYILLQHPTVGQSST